MKKAQKNNNSFTINLNDDLKNELLKVAETYQRKPAELLRLLVAPVIINEYAKIQQRIYKENAQPLQEATFKQL